jgi:nucleoside phosphorylase
MRGRLETARVAVLTIIEEEFLCAKRALNAVHDLEGDLGGYWTTNVESYDVVLKRAADRGGIQAVTPTKDMVEIFQPEIVLVVGIAGGIEGRDDIKLGDVVVADYLHDSEFRKLTEGADRPRFAAYDHPSVVLRERLVEPVKYLPWQTRIVEDPPEPVSRPPTVHIGGVVATAKVMGDAEHPEQRRLVAQFDNALAVEMESVGVGRAIHESRVSVNYNVRFLVIRGISDFVKAKPSGVLAGSFDSDDAAVVENNVQRQEWKPYAADAAASFAAELVERILKTPNPRGE